MRCVLRYLGTYATKSWLHAKYSLQADPLAPKVGGFQQIPRLTFDR